MKISPRHLVWVNLVLLALVAYWGASAVSTAIAAKLAPPPEVRLSLPPPPIPKEPHRPASYYDLVHTRDLFNSTKPEAPKLVEPPKVTECKVKLWGVVVHTRPDESYAIIEDLAAHKQDLLHVGQMAGNCGTVKRVEWDRVLLDRDGREEFIDLVQPQGGGGGPARPGPVMAAAVPPHGDAAAPGGATAAAAAGGHVQKVGDTEYNIDRSEVDSALDNMNQLFTQIRAVPHFDGGKSTGFRLFAIRQGSIFDQIGLQNGDIIQRINGTEINDPSRALALFNELRNQRQLAIDILRNKESKTLSYNIN